ncbi:MAG: hypothetical protein EHM70_22000 [Chloroflexota bacterium]|nr:MAG: hypothetical protein EHM70_22000 [Chloroflexota bacterium]
MAGRPTGKGNALPKAGIGANLLDAWRRNPFLGLYTFLGISVVILLGFILSIHALTPNDTDWMAIETTLRTYAEIKEEALYSLDDSRLVQVLANDPRGGLVDPMFLKPVQWMTGNTDLKLKEVGFLHVEQARYAFDREVKELYPEIRELQEETGWLGRLPAPRPEKVTPMSFKILSILVKGDLAYAKVDWGYGLCDDILVNKDGGWYLIGHKVIEWHGG